MIDLKNKLTTKEIFYIEEGKKEYNFFRADVEDALLNNPFGDQFIFSSLPGYGKTHTTNEVAKLNGVNLVKFEGSLGLFAFAADLATVLLAAPQDDSKIYCIFDDCDSLFDKGDNLNTVKGMFDAGRQVLAYGKQLGAQYHALDETQQAAIDAFREEGRSGFRIPTERFVFITLTNRWFPNQDDVENATDSKKSYYNGLAAVRRRVQYKEMTLQNGYDWGYCANIFLNYPLAEKFFPDITEEQKIEILKFSSPTNQWNNLVERNLSIFEKMVKDMVRFPDNYYDRWVSQYIK
jgi:hypothetical protein